MEDINSAVYNEQGITPADILKFTTETQIYATYLGTGIVNSGAISSPFRVDQSPSFSVFYGSKVGKVMWKDLSTGESGDWVMFVRKWYHWMNFNDVLMRVSVDLGIEHKLGIINQNSEDVKKQVDLAKSEELELRMKARSAEKVKIGIRPRKELSKVDLKFWGQYYITPEWLRFYRVFSCEYLYIGEQQYPFEISINNPAYAYLEFKDGVPTYKIYRPLHPNPNYKWRNNGDFSVWEGWEQLPKSGPLLIITKSRKDVMSIRATTGIPAISLNAESVYPKPHVLEQLRKRFPLLIVFYDNDWRKKDNPGRLYGEKLASDFNLSQIEIPQKRVHKDYTDLIVAENLESARELLIQLILEETGMLWDIASQQLYSKPF